MTTRYGLQVEFDTDDGVTRSDARRYLREALTAWSREWPGLVRDLRIKYVHEATSTRKDPRK